MLLIKQFLHLFLRILTLKGAKGVLINITSGNDLKMREVHEIMSVISQYSTSDATVIVGTVIDDSLRWFS